MLEPRLSLALGVKVPRLVVNTKAYAESSGPTASLRLARQAAAGLAAPTPSVAWCVPAADLATIAAAAIPGLQTWAQHVDPQAPGAATGWFTAEMARLAGAYGTLLNHAEHKLPVPQLEQCVDRARGAGLAVLLCADSTAEAVRLAALRPDAIAIEPPELIGGNLSVTRADPAIVRDAVAAVRRVADIPVLCGAGVKTGADAAAALGLGAHGVLLASGIVKAKDPAAALSDLAAGLSPPARASAPSPAPPSAQPSNRPRTPS